MIKVLDEAVGDLRQIDIDVRLHSNIDLRAGCMPGQARQTIEGLADELSPETATASDPCCSACATI